MDPIKVSWTYKSFSIIEFYDIWCILLIGHWALPSTTLVGWLPRDYQSFLCGSFYYGNVSQNVQSWVSGNSIHIKMVSSQRKWLSKSYFRVTLCPCSTALTALLWSVVFWSWFLPMRTLCHPWDCQCCVVSGFCEHSKSQGKKKCFQYLISSAYKAIYQVRQ